MNKQLLVFASVLFAVLFIGVLSVLLYGINSKALDAGEDALSVMDSNVYKLPLKRGEKITVSGQELINIIHYYANVDTNYYSTENYSGTNNPSNVIEFDVQKLGVSVKYTESSYSFGTGSNIIKYNKNNDYNENSYEIDLYKQYVIRASELDANNKVRYDVYYYY